MKCARQKWRERPGQSDDQGQSTADRAINAVVEQVGGQCGPSNRDGPVGAAVQGNEGPNTKVGLRGEHHEAEAVNEKRGGGQNGHRHDSGQWCDQQSARELQYTNRSGQGCGDGTRVAAFAQERNQVRCERAHGEAGEGKADGDVPEGARANPVACAWRRKNRA